MNKIVLTDAEVRILINSHLSIANEFERLVHGDPAPVDKQSLRECRDTHLSRVNELKELTSGNEWGRL